MGDKTMRAVQFDAKGGPEVLILREIERPMPKPGQVRVRHEAIGINFIDTYHRTGLYPVKLPCTPGGEAAGEKQPAQSQAQSEGR